MNPLSLIFKLLQLLCARINLDLLKKHGGEGARTLTDLTLRKVKVSYFTVGDLEVESIHRSCIRKGFLKNITNHWYLFSKFIC